jgi:hypothetical protein
MPRNVQLRRGMILDVGESGILFSVALRGASTLWLRMDCESSKEKFSLQHCGRQEGPS